MIKDTKLFITLDKITNLYKTIQEANEPPFPTGPDDIEGQEDMGGTQDLDNMETGEEDPTKTPSKEDIPENEDGAFISDTKLAMYASTLLKAYQTQPTSPIPSELLNVTRDNANEVIKYIEDSLQLDKPTQDIDSDLSKL